MGIGRCLAVPALFVAAGCTQTGMEGAADVAGQSALLTASQFDPTGVTTMMHIGHVVAQVKAAEARRANPVPPRVDLSAIFTPLADVAGGKLGRPSNLGVIKTRMAVQHGMMIGATAVRGAMGGGIGMAMAAPGLAMQAAHAGRAAGAVAAGEGRVAAYEAKRSAERTVPDADRPAEATALMTILDQPQGRSVEWSNPATGGRGRVTVRGERKFWPGIPCRAVAQEWGQGSATRRGELIVCNQDGIWYDLS